MNRKMTVGNRSGAKAGRLAFKRETIRTLTAPELKEIAGGQRCRVVDSCVNPSCAPNSCGEFTGLTTA